MGEFIEILPPMKRVSDEWYQGTADAVYQNLQSILTEAPDQVLILSADHIYKMNYRRHDDLAPSQEAPTSRSPPSRCDPGEAQPVSAWREIEPDYRISGFEEKPQHGNPVRSVFDPAMVSASMGIYIFKTQGADRRADAPTRQIPTPRTISARTFCRSVWSGGAW